MLLAPEENTDMPNVFFIVRQKPCQKIGDITISTSF